MRFVYIVHKPELLPQLRIGKDHNDNLYTMNEGPIASDSYFTCGDLVFDFSTATGEIISADGYLPCFNDLERKVTNWPTLTIPAKLYVGDLSDRGLFAVPKLYLSISEDGKIIHAGLDSSGEYVAISDSLVVGLTDCKMTEIFIRLTT